MRMTKKRASVELARILAIMEAIYRLDVVEFPTVVSIVNNTMKKKCSDKTVMRYLTMLEDIGFVVKTVRQRLKSDPIYAYQLSKPTKIKRACAVHMRCTQAT